MDNVLREIAAERQRQIDAEGWSHEHDDAHPHGDLALAAMAYAAPDYWRQWSAKRGIQLWPWEQSVWKPKDRRRNLIRAAALLVAEIERLDRAKAREGE